MLIVKIIFWMMAANVVNTFQCGMDHPRERSDINLGADIVVFIIHAALTIFLGMFIWN